MATDLQRLARISSDTRSHAVFRRYYCTECRSIWESAEASRTFYESLLSAKDEADELKRQVAMLRFMLANEKRHHAIGDIAA